MSRTIKKAKTTMRVRWSDECPCHVSNSDLCPSPEAGHADRACCSQIAVRACSLVYACWYGIGMVSNICLTCAPMLGKSCGTFGHGCCNLDVISLSVVLVQDPMVYDCSRPVLGMQLAGVELGMTQNRSHSQTYTYQSPVVHTNCKIIKDRT